MSKHGNYKNAPITEAVFDIQVVLPTGFDFTKFSNFNENFAKEYPTREAIINYRSSVQIKKGEEPVQTTEKETNGFLFKSVDSKKIIQLRTVGFSFNKLKPYDDWENFSSEAKKYFEEYLKITQPVKIVRVGLRFINLFKIPLPIKGFEEYINTLPTISPKITPNLSDFFMRLMFPEEKNPLNMAIISEAISDADNSDNTLPLVLDVDVFRTANLDVDIEKLYKIFDELRLFKNCIFENSITEKMKELIS